MPEISPHAPSRCCKKDAIGRNFKTEGAWTVEKGEVPEERLLGDLYS